MVTIDVKDNKIGEIKKYVANQIDDFILNVLKKNLPEADYRAILASVTSSDNWDKVRGILEINKMTLVYTHANQIMHIVKDGEEIGSLSVDVNCKHH
jgi:hypothetical protein